MRIVPVLSVVASLVAALTAAAQQPTDYRFISPGGSSSSGNWSNASNWSNPVNGQIVPPSAASTRLLFTSQFSPITRNDLTDFLCSYLEVGVNGATINGNGFTMTRFNGVNPTINFSGANSNTILNLNTTLTTAASFPTLEVRGTGKLILQPFGQIKASTVNINGPSVVLNASNTSEQIVGLTSGTFTNIRLDAGILDLNGRSLSISSLAGTGGFVVIRNDGTLTTNTAVTTTYSGGVFHTSGGTLVKSGGGTLGLIGVGGSTADITADLRVTAGTLVLSKSTADSVQSSVILVESGAVAGATATNDQLNRSTSLRLVGTGKFIVEGSRQTVGTISGDPNSKIELNPLTLAGITTQGTLRVGNGNTSSIYSGDITGTGNFEKIGTGTFSNAFGLTYTGTTTVSGGTLELGQTIATSRVTVASGGTLAGAPTLTNGDVVVQSGGTVSPGSSVGTINLKSLLLDGGSTVRVEVQSNPSAPGTEYTDLLNASGGASFGSSSSANRIRIRLASLGSTGAPGNLLNFDPSVRHDWTFLVAAGGLTGFNTDRFELDASAFQGGVYDLNQFSITQQGNALRVTFTPVPEPAFLLVATLPFVLLLKRRQRRPNQPSLA